MVFRFESVSVFYAKVACCFILGNVATLIAPYIILNLQQQSPWVGDGAVSRHQLQSPVRAITNLPGTGIMACRPHHRTKASLTVTGVASF